MTPGESGARSLRFFVLVRVSVLPLPAMDHLPEPQPKREPIFNVPGVIILLIGSFVLVHLWRMMLDDEGDLNFLVETAFVPARLAIAFGMERADDLLNSVIRAASAADRARSVALVQVFVGDGETRLWTLVTYAFLHGGFTHLFVNSIWLLAFGTAVARRFAPIRFLVFFAFCAAVGALVQWLGDMESVQPVIGASGAIAGMMGAALRFMFRDEIRLGPGAELYAFIPRLSLAETFSNKRVLIFAAFMLGINILMGLGFQLVSGSDLKVAWQAHLGGFLAGMLAFSWFDPVPPEQP